MLSLSLPGDKNLYFNHHRTAEVILSLSEQVSFVSGKWFIPGQIRGMSFFIPRAIYIWCCQYIICQAITSKTKKIVKIYAKIVA